MQADWGPLTNVSSLFRCTAPICHLYETILAGYHTYYNFTS